MVNFHVPQKMKGKLIAITQKKTISSHQVMIKENEETAQDNSE